MKNVERFTGLYDGSARTIGILLVVVAFEACSRPSPPGPPPDVSVAAPGRQSASEPTASAQPVSGPAERADAPAPTASTSRAGAAPKLELFLRGPGALVIRNRGNAPTRLAWAAAIERKTDGGWTRMATELRLFEQCPEPPPPPDACVELAPGATLRPRPWSGFFGCTQCDTCRANAPAAAGTYRFVVTSCDGATSYASDLSILDRDGHIAGPPWAD